jgi:HEAT repeat protein
LAYVAEDADDLEEVVAMKPSEASGRLLRDILLDDPVPSVRRSAAEALGYLGTPLAFVAVDALTEGLVDGSADIRESCAKTLRKLGPSVCTPDIVKQMK